MRIKVFRTKKNYPAIWEGGGGYTNTGEAIIIANRDGSPKSPIYIARRGSLANGNHALFIINKDDIIIMADHHRRDFEITVLRFEGVEQDEYGEFGITTPLTHYSMGEWDDEKVAQKYEAAIDAAMEKATCYHCREPHFIKTE